MMRMLGNRLLLWVEPLSAPARQWLQAELAPRYEQLERREQRLVVVATTLLPLMLLLFLVILPMQDRQIQLRHSVAALQLQAREASQLAAQLLASGGGKALQPVNVLSSVERIARQSNVRQYMTRIRPQNRPDNKGQFLMVQLKSAPYKDIVRFVDALAKAKLNLSSMKIKAAGSAGLAHAQAVIGSL
ncbi:MAG: type II secretion system protein GspM [Mariprofundus sp.]